MGTRCNVIFYDSNMTSKDVIEKQLDRDTKNTSPMLHFSILYRHWDGYAVGDDIRHNKFFENYNKRYDMGDKIAGSPLTHMVSSFQKWSFDNLKKSRMDKFLETFNVKNIWGLRRNMRDMPISQIAELSSAIYDLTYDWNKMGHYEITTCIHGDIEYLWWIDIRSQEVEGYHKTYKKIGPTDVFSGEYTWEKVEEKENE
tara:strand:- start:319 stop:915 length:597 start_codon:yes stop_codon:yes gene_type:complete